MIVVLSAFALALLWLLREPIAWVLLAVFTAAALSGPVGVLGRYMKRGFAITLVMLALILVPIGLGAIVVPPVVTGATQLFDKAPDYANQIQEEIQTNPKLQGIEEKYHISDKMKEKVDELPNILGDTAEVLAGIGGTLASSAAALATILVMAVFMLAGGDRWIAWAVAQQPKHHRARTERILNDSTKAIGNYIAGNMLISLVAGISAYIVMLILGIPFAAPLAVAVALFDLIPMIGSLLAGILVGLVSLFVDFPTATIVWAIWMIVYQQLENNLIQPHIQKKSVDINPLLTIIAVLFGSALFGIIGALLAIPVAAMIQIIVKEWWAYRGKSVTPKRV